MRVTRPDVVPDGLYNITQAAAALGVERHTVASYMAQGLLAFRIRKAGNAKVCTGEAIIKCWETMYL